MAIAVFSPKTAEPDGTQHSVEPEVTRHDVIRAIAMLRGLGYAVVMTTPGYRVVDKNLIRRYEGVGSLSEQIMDDESYRQHVQFDAMRKIAHTFIEDGVVSIEERFNSVSRRLEFHLRVDVIAAKPKEA